MNQCNTRVTLEVIEIESKNRVHLVNGHRGNDSSIVAPEIDPHIERLLRSEAETIRFA